MKRILIDSNIILDYWLERPPFYNGARHLLKFAFARDYELWVSTAQLPSLGYIVSKGNKWQAEECKKALIALHKVVHFCPLSEKQAEQALQSPWENLEDAFIHQAAIGIGADVLVTRNKKHFERSAIPVMDANEFFGWMYEKNNRGYGEITPEGVTVAGLD